MTRHWLWLIFALASSFSITAHPVESSKSEDTADDNFVAKSERSWLWGWAWGAESTVSVVDHTPVISFPSRPAAFGAEIRDPILGYIIPFSSFTTPCHAKSENSSREPNTGCPDLCLRGSQRPTETWIALVQRGQCEFVKKVREAQQFGAKAVVVGGEDPAKTGYPDTLVNMYSPDDSSDIKIAATYVRFSDYSRLMTLIDSSNTTHSGLRTLTLLITAEYSAWEWYSPIVTFVLILLLPSALTFLTLLVHRIRAIRAAQRDRAPENVVRNLPLRVWTGTHWEKQESRERMTECQFATNPDLEQGQCNKASDGDEDDSNASTSHPKGDPVLRPWFEAQLECAICLSEFVKGDKVRVLPCHHIFHVDEVDEWLIHRKKLCPICKADVTQPPQPESDRFTFQSADHESDTTSRLSAEHATERTPLLQQIRHAATL